MSTLVERAEALAERVRAGELTHTQAADLLGGRKPSEPQLDLGLSDNELLALALVNSGKGEVEALQEALRADPNLEEHRTKIEAERKRLTDKMTRDQFQRWEVSPEGLAARADALAVEKVQKAALVAKAELLLEEAGEPFEGATDDEKIQAAGLDPHHPKPVLKKIEGKAGSSMIVDLNDPTSFEGPKS